MTKDFSDKYWEFYGIKLVFENKTVAEQLKQVWADYFEKSEGERPFNMLIDYSNENNGDYIYKLDTIHNKAFYEAKLEPAQIGKWLLEALDKYINIADISQEFRNSPGNIRMRIEDIPAEFKTSSINTLKKI